MSRSSPVELIRGLLVDDDPSGLPMVRDALDSEPGAFEVTDCESTNAESLLCRNSFDFVLTELEGLRLLHGRNGVPVIVVTRRNSEAAAVESLRAGASDYFPKAAAELARLPAAIRQALSRGARDGATQAALELSHGGTWHWSVADDRVQWDRSMYRAFGFPPRTAPRNWAEYVQRVHPEDRPRVEAEVGRALRCGDNLESEHRLLCPDGTERMVAVRGRVLRGAGGKAHEIVCGCCDSTPRYEADELRKQVRQAEPMAVVAAQVAHDFNNLLTVTACYATQLMNSVATGDPSRELATEILRASERGEALAGHLLSFSRPEPAHPRLFDLNQRIRELEKTLRSLAGDGAVRLHLCAENPAVLADPRQIGQAIMNLAIHGRNTIARGATLEIETTMAERGECTTSAARGAFARICTRLSDSCATSPELCSEANARKAGLWLLGAAEIVKRNGGFVSSPNELGGETVLNIYLPSPARDPALPAPPSTCGRGGTILLVEDDPQLRSMVAQGLTITGYNVLVAARPQEALQLAREHPGPVHLLLADLVLPGQRGDDLARQVLEYKPSAKVLYMSGYRHQLSDAVRASFLAKPFTLETLARRIGELIDSAHRRLSVLLVDDDDSIVSSLTGVLSRQGFDVHSAGAADDALRQWRAAAFDLAVVDLKLPDRNGAEAIIEMRQARPATPVIAISGAFGPNFLKMMESMGVAAAIPKPIQPAKFLSAVRQALRFPSNGD